MDGAESEGAYCFLYVSDDYNCENLQYCREYYYSRNYYDDEYSMLCDIGIISCGGMYTAIGTYLNGHPLMLDIDMNYIVPHGSQTCISYVSDDF